MIFDKTIGGYSLIRPDCYIDKTEWQSRLDLLNETISKYLIAIPEKEITNEYLFTMNVNY